MAVPPVADRAQISWLKPNLVDSWLSHSQSRNGRVIAERISFQALKPHDSETPPVWLESLTREVRRYQTALAIRKRADSITAHTPPQ